MAALVDAEYLFLLTDVDGLYTANPSSDPTAVKIPVVEDINALEVDVNSGAGSNMGTGGMVTKLTAARIASAAGCQTVICLASVQSTAIEDVLEGKTGIGTVFLAAKKSAQGRSAGCYPCPSRVTCTSTRTAPRLCSTGWRYRSPTAFRSKETSRCKRACEYWTKMAPNSGADSQTTPLVPFEIFSTWSQRRRRRVGRRLGPGRTLGTDKLE